MPFVFEKLACSLEMNINPAFQEHVKFELTQFPSRDKKEYDIVSRVPYRGQDPIFTFSSVRLHSHSPSLMSRQRWNCGLNRTILSNIDESDE